MLPLLAEAAGNLADPKTLAIAGLVSAVVFLYKQSTKDRENTKKSLENQAKRLRAELEEIRENLRNCYKELHDCDVDRERLYGVVAGLKGISVKELKAEMALPESDEGNS